MAGLMSSGGLKKTLKYVDIQDPRTLNVPGYPNVGPIYTVNVRAKLPPEIYTKLTKENICVLSTFAYSTGYSTNDNYVIIDVFNYTPSSGEIDFTLQATYDGRVKNITFRVYYLD